jgi:hypothetical protein
MRVTPLYVRTYDVPKINVKLELGIYEECETVEATSRDNNNLFLKIARGTYEPCSVETDHTP